MDFVGPEASFDIVCALGMFEYVEDPKATLTKMVYHLKPGGTLFIDAHSSSPLYNIIRRWRNRQQTAKGGIPKQLYDADDMCSLLEAVGLNDTRILMTEFPFIGTLYARTGWRWVIALRNVIAERPAFRFLGTNFNAVALRPQ